MLLGALLSLGAGYVVLQVVTEGIVILWEHIPESLGTSPFWYVIALPLVAAVAVYLIRTYVGDSGHSPLGGLQVHPLTPREYLGAILAIFASLIGGAVLGPEVALISTGAVIGGLVAKITKVQDSQSVVAASAGGAILALFVNPLLSGSLELGGRPDTVEVDQLLWAVGVALVATLLITAARFVANLLNNFTANGPHLIVLIGSALFISVAAIIMNITSELPFAYIATSGEELITELPTLTSISTVVGIMILKTIAYAVSLGSGFRGGPFFPAMFIGAATGLLATLLLPEGPSTVAAMTVGVVAAVIATAPMKWPIAVILGGVIGFAMGGWAVIPAAVIGAVIARAIPRVKVTH